MTQEEKAKAYDEAMNKIKPLYEQAKRDGNPIWSTYEYLFPELRESEDERVIRTLYYLVRDHDWLNGATKGEALTWLEKQKESLHISESCKEKPCSFTCEQKPAWSEEDERKIRQLVALLKSSKEKCMAAFYKDIDECIAWVCDLRPSWKPSEEQMEAFRRYIEDFQARAEAAVGGWNNFDVMIRLYEQLIKL